MPLDDLVDWGEFDKKLSDKVKINKVFDDKQVAHILKNKVIGQDKVADQVTNQLKRRLAQTNRNKPLGVFCFAGPPGVGKTYFAKVLAENMYQGKGRLHHVDMTQMAQPHSKSALIGSPPGYVGGSGTLTTALLNNPKFIVLLDEFEKAHDEVHKVFLTAWNDGFITDAHTGRKISTTDAIFLITTNAASDQLLEIEHNFKTDADLRDKAVTEALKQEGYAPEVLSRINYIFVFEPLSEKNLAKVAVLELSMLAQRYGLVLTQVDPGYLIELLGKADAFQGGGIRGLTELVDRQFGDQFIEVQNKGAKSVRIVQKDDKAIVESELEVA